MQIFHLPVVDSTSDHLRRLACQDDRPEPWTAILADRQTAGHGQHGRPWSSDAKGLYASILLPPEVASPVFTLAAGLAALQATQAVSGARALGLKWVNDLVWASPGPDGTTRIKKIGGILAEAVHQRFVILGIGINLGPVHLLDAASLTEAAGRPVDPMRLLEAFGEDLKDTLEHLRNDGPGDVIARWKSASVTLGRLVRVDALGEIVEGMAEDIDQEGHLILRLADGTTKSIRSGTVRLANGAYA